MYLVVVSFQLWKSAQWERGGATERAEAPAGKTQECEDETGTNPSVERELSYKVVSTFKQLHGAKHLNSFLPNTIEMAFSKAL